MAFKILLISIFCWLGSIENSIPFGFTFSNAIGKPIVGGAIVGIILGQPTQGVMIGAAIQTMYLANAVVGGVAAADTTFVAYPSIALAMMAGASTEVAMSIAATVGILGAALFSLWETFCSVFYAMGDKAIEDGNEKAMHFIYTWLPGLVDLLFRGGLTFAILMLGNEYAAAVLASIPDVVLTIAGVLGGLLPAVGMSILLAYTLKDIKAIVFFILGVVMASSLGMSMITIAIIGACFAVIYYMLITRNDTAVQIETTEDEEF
jgi:PTS system mannose-specific IIC component